MSRGHQTPQLQPLLSHALPGRNATTSFLYDEADVVIDRASDNSQVAYLNGPGIDSKLRQTNTQTGSLYFLQDQLGSTTSLTDSSGGVVERSQYEPFGGSSGSSLTRFTYTGREKDNLTGLMYYRARWYDPQQGRFLSEDPAGFAGGLNKYAYAGDDPINKTDPLGLFDVDVHYYLTITWRRRPAVSAIRKQGKSLKEISMRMRMPIKNRDS